MSAKSKKSAKAIDRPFDAHTMAKAVKVAEQYQVILAFEDGHWYGRGLELPNIHGDGKTVNQCVENTREAFAGWVAYLLEEGQRPPTPAREGTPHGPGECSADVGRKGAVGGHREDEKGSADYRISSAPRPWNWPSDRAGECRRPLWCRRPACKLRQAGRLHHKTSKGRLTRPGQSATAKLHHTLMERELISWLRERLPPHPLLRLGPGDDAAVLRMAGVDECVVTVDMLTDHVDFELAEVDPRRVGRKALAANLSDLAAMASQAAGRRGRAGLAPAGRHGIGQGTLRRHAAAGRAVRLGHRRRRHQQLGRTAGHQHYAAGEVTGRGPLCRSGARPGDRIVVTGSFGGSILGRHLDFEPRVREALELHARYELHAGIDVSDGLSLDLAHILEESRCGAVLRADAVPIADDARRLADKLADGSTPLDARAGRRRGF